LATSTTLLGLSKPAVGETNYPAGFSSSMDIIDAIPGKPAGANAGGLTGATAGTRFVGGTTSGAPVSGTFSVGDYVIDRTGRLWICTTAGSPGTWVDPVTLIDVWVPFTIEGTLTVSTNSKRLPVLGPCQVIGARFTVTTAPAGSSCTMTLLRNGSTAMFSVNPTITAGNQMSSFGTVIGSPTLTTSQWLQVGFSSVGTTTPATDAVGMIGLRRTGPSA